MPSSLDFAKIFHFLPYLASSHRSPLPSNPLRVALPFLDQVRFLSPHLTSPELDLPRDSQARSSSLLQQTRRSPCDLSHWTRSGGGGTDRLKRAAFTICLKQTEEVLQEWID